MFERLKERIVRTAEQYDMRDLAEAARAATTMTELRLAVAVYGTSDLLLMLDVAASENDD